MTIIMIIVKRHDSRRRRPWWFAFSIAKGKVIYGGTMGFCVFVLISS
jgi:hypothetical protein